MNGYFQNIEKEFTIINRTVWIVLKWLFAFARIHCLFVELVSACIIIWSFQKFCTLTIRRQWGKFSSAVFFRKCWWKHTNYLNIFLYQANIDDSMHSMCNAVSAQWPLLRVNWDHTRSNTFLRPSFDRIKIKHWRWSQCVSLAEIHQLLCNTTYLGYQVTATDLYLRSDFYLELSRSTIQHAYVLMRFDKRNRMAFVFPQNFAVQKLFLKNRIVKKAYLTFFDLQRLICWSKDNSERELSFEEIVQ